MSTTTSQNINIRNNTEPKAFPMLSGDTFYHGTLAAIAATGYAENFDSSSLPVAVGVVAEINGSHASAGDTSTGTGAIATAENLVTLYTDGYIDSIPFNSDAAVTSVGQLAYVKDNFTLTTDPADGVIPFGIITKYYSTTKAEVKINCFALEGVLEYVDAIPGTAASSIIYAIGNPVGDTVIIKDWHIYIATAASSVIAASAGVAATSTTPATNLVATGALSMGTAGCYGPAKTTNFLNNIQWTSSEYIVLSACSQCSTGTSALVAYIKLRYEIV
jgi:hypothetical protein